MRVVRLRAPGGPEQLALEEVDRPRPGPGEALVRVLAAAITRGELEWPLDRLPAIRPMNFPVWLRNSALALQASRRATRCSRSRGSTTTA